MARTHGGKCDRQLPRHLTKVAALHAKISEALQLQLEPEVVFGRESPFEIVEISARRMARSLHPREWTIQHEGKVRTGGTDISSHENICHKLAYESICVDSQRIGENMASLMEGYGFGAQNRIEWIWARRERYPRYAPET